MKKTLKYVFPAALVLLWIILYFGKVSGEYVQLGLFWLPVVLVIYFFAVPKTDAEGQTRPVSKTISTGIFVLSVLGVIGFWSAAINIFLSSPDYMWGVMFLGLGCFPLLFVFIFGRNVFKK